MASIILRPETSHISKHTEVFDYRNEQWQAIDDFYEVSSLGRVAGIGGRLLHRRMNDFGYFVVRLSSPRRIEEVHRLVALAFVPNPTRLPAAIHVNGNPTDNRPVNLKWCSSESQAFTRSLRPRRKFPQLTARSRPGGKVENTVDRGSSAGCERVSRAIPPVVRKHILRCRHCSHRWPDDVQIAIGETASSFCPGCGTRNTWSHSAVLKRGHRQAQAACAD
jgi:hypothetical protein